MMPERMAHAYTMRPATTAGSPSLAAIQSGIAPEILRTTATRQHAERQQHYHHGLFIAELATEPGRHQKLFHLSRQVVANVPKVRGSMYAQEYGYRLSNTWNDPGNTPILHLHTCLGLVRQPGGVTLTKDLQPNEDGQ